MTIYDAERFGGIAHEVVTEAIRSIDKHGEQTHLPMGTGPDTAPLGARAVEPGSLHESGLWPGMRARQLARIATLDTKSHSANEGGDDTCTWWLILREEVFEAASEAEPDKLRAELVQVAAVALKMIDALDHRSTVPAHTRVEIPERVMVFNVDASWSNYRGSRYNGDLAPGDASKFHLNRGDSTARCSPRVLLNALPGDVGEWLDELEREAPTLVCRRCVPRPTAPSPTDHTDGDQNA